MTKFSNAADIVELSPILEDFQEAARYASITLPWTFNRMMANTSAKGQNGRALNIAKGIINQELLRRELKARGLDASTQRKSHRADDLFDFILVKDDKELLIDLKTIHHYSNYEVEGRPPISTQIIADGANYNGPLWSQFFPMMVPHTQINQAKEAYCFAISSSFDFRSNPFDDRPFDDLTAFPFGELLPFLSGRKLVEAREEAGQGFYCGFEYKDDDLLAPEHISFQILGEWEGDLSEVDVTLDKNDEPFEIGPWSCISCLKITRDTYESLSGKIKITVTKNTLRKVIRNTAKRNINTAPKGSLEYTRNEFCNLALPNDFRLLVIGWTLKTDFLNSCQDYSGWVWPSDKIDRLSNQAWTQKTENDKKLLGKLGFPKADNGPGTQVNIGLLKTHGRGGGACCFVFPNIGFNGGVKETNLFVLPGDLNTLDSL